jgi:hypothetical protein
VVQGGDGARFPLEPAAELCQRDLDGDRATHPRIARAVDLAHAARTDERRDLIRAKSATDERGCVVCERTRRCFQSRCVDQGRFAVGGQERLDLVAELLVVRASVAQIVVPSRRGRANASW